MSAILFPVLQWCDNNSKPLAAGSIYTYLTSSSTPLATYTDSTGGTQASNPIVLDSGGRAQIWLGTVSNYKFVVQDYLGNPIETIDPIGTNSASGLSNPVNIAQGGWNASTVTQGKINYGLTTGVNIEAWSAQLDAVSANNSTTGLVCQTGTNTVASRTLTAGSTKVTITNPAGVAGNPTVDVAPSNITIASLSGYGTAASQNVAVFAQVANNLSDVTAATARTNLSVPSNAQACLVANNLSDVTAATARTNLSVSPMPLNNNITSATYTIVAGDSGKFITYAYASPAAVGTLTLTAPATLGNGFTCTVFNNSGTLGTTMGITIAITPASGLINGAATMQLEVGDVATIYCDGSNFFCKNSFTGGGVFSNGQYNLTPGVIQGMTPIAPTTLTTMTTGVIYYIPFILNRTTTIISYSFNVGTTSAATNAVIGIYPSNYNSVIFAVGAGYNTSCTPSGSGAIAGTTKVVSMAASGAVNSTGVSVVLAAGIYWLAYSQSSSTPQPKGFTTSQTCMYTIGGGGFYLDTGAATAATNCYYAAFTYSSTLPSATAGSITQLSGAILPAISINNIPGY